MKPLTKAAALKLEQGDEVWIVLGNRRDPDGELRGHVDGYGDERAGVLYFNVIIPRAFATGALPGRTSHVGVRVFSARTGREITGDWVTQRKVPHTHLMVR